MPHALKSFAGVQETAKFNPSFQNSTMRLKVNTLTTYKFKKQEKVIIYRKFI